MKLRISYGGTFCVALMLSAMGGLEASRRPPKPPAANGTKYAAYYGKADSNHCVVDVIKTFNTVPGKVTKTGGYSAAWNSGMIRFPRYTANFRNKLGLNNHFQGINRLNPHVGLGSYAVVSGGDPHSNTAHLFVVKISSRTSGRSGGVPRWGGNRYSTPDGPPVADRIVAVHNLDGYYWHAGGMQTLGRYLAVPVENGKAGKSRVYVYDMADPINPVRLRHHIQRYSTGGVAALTKLPNGYFMMAVWSDNDHLDFYGSWSPSILSSWRWMKNWNPNRVKSAYGQDKNFGEYQTINFINQCDGELFMVGLHNSAGMQPTKPGGRDFADLYLVNNPNDVNFYSGRSMSTTRFAPVITKVANKHLYCKDDQCNFDAAGGVFIPDNNNIWIYGAYHWLKSHSGGRRQLRFNEYASRKTVTGGRVLRGGPVRTPGPGNNGPILRRLRN